MMVNDQVGVVNNDDVGMEEEDVAEELTSTAHLIRSNATTLHANHLKCAHAVTIPYLFPPRHRRHRCPPPPSHCLSLFPIIISCYHSMDIYPYCILST